MADLGISQHFDVVTAFDAIHDQAAPAAVLQGVSDALTPDGVFLCVDVAASSHLEENIDHPLGPVIYTISTFHCMTVSLALDGAGLGVAWGSRPPTPCSPTPASPPLTLIASRATRSTCTTWPARADIGGGFAEGQRLTFSLRTTSPHRLVA